MTKEENEGVGKGHITGGTITHSRNYDTGVGSREDRDPHRLWYESLHIPSLRRGVPKSSDFPY